MMMMIKIKFFTFMFLFPLTASRAVTAGQNVTDVMSHSQPTAQDSSSSHPPSGISGPDITQRTTIHKNLTQPSPPSLQTTPTTPLKTLPPNIPTTATKSQTSPQSNLTLGQKTTPPATTVLTNQASTVNLTSTGPTNLTSSTQSQDSGKTSTPQISSSKTQHPSTHPTQTTDLTATSTTPAKSKSPSPSPDGGVTESTSSFRTSKAATKAPLIHTTKANKGQGSPKKQSGDSKAVAGIIGGALVLMMLGFLIIYLKKRKLRKQQITTNDWAGPSPFLEGGADNGQVELRSNNRISLSSFLPQRLSKRLSLLPETEEEMEDLTPGSTFGDKTQSSSFGREVAGDGVKESNGMAGVNTEMKRKDSAERAEKALATNNNSEDAKLSPDLSAGQTPPAADMENIPEHLSNGPEQP